ncbi:Acyl-CoA-binding domain-containing protein 6 [Galdieria sulphuraria]|nr:Acyl-CoA-binding domain-containing protein 6 [Galdieria sulphuraria]
MNETIAIHDVEVSLEEKKETTKWKSWRQASNLSKEEAMSKYILLSAKYKNSSTSQAPVLDLCYFSAIGDISSIRYLLEKDPSSVHLKDESVVVLLEYEASVDAVDREGQSALHYACICEYPDVVLQLVKAGADIYLEDFQGQSPWHIASPTIRLQLHPFLSIHD